LVICAVLVEIEVEVIVAVDVSISVVDFTDVVASVVDVIEVMTELLVDGSNVVVGVTTVVLLLGVVDINAVEVFVSGANVDVSGPIVTVPFVEDNDVVDFVFSVGWVVFNWLVVPTLETVLAFEVRVGKLVAVASVEDSVDVCSIVLVLMSVVFVVASPVVTVVSVVSTPWDVGGSLVDVVVVGSECWVLVLAKVVYC